jgi:hypothetical protein
MKYQSLIVGFSVATLVSGFALAHGGGGHGGKRHMDTNKDGKITLDEALAGAKARFAKVDANKDGSLTREELTKFAEASGGNRPPAGQPEGRPGGERAPGTGL